MWVVDREVVEAYVPHLVAKDPKRPVLVFALEKVGLRGMGRSYTSLRLAPNKTMIPPPAAQGWRWKLARPSPWLRRAFFFHRLRIRSKGGRVLL
jgi:hypothetical protein